MRYSVQLLVVIIFITTTSFAQNVPSLRKTSLKSTTPSDEIVRLDINKDGKPDILERWWNGKRVRWLDENGDMLPTDTRGDRVADVMQIDKNGDGLYDSNLDINIKWADNDGDGRADLEAFVTQGREWSDGKWDAGDSHWMVFIDVEKDGVLGYLDWTRFDFGNDTTKGNETDYDMSLRGGGGPGVPYRTFVHKYPALKGNPKFDGCFQWNNWRKIDELMYMPHEKSYDSFFTDRKSVV